MQVSPYMTTKLLLAHAQLQVELANKKLAKFKTHLEENPFHALDFVDELHDAAARQNVFGGIVRTLTAEDTKATFELYGYRSDSSPRAPADSIYDYAQREVMWADWRSQHAQNNSSKLAIRAKTAMWAEVVLFLEDRL